MVSNLQVETLGNLSSSADYHYVNLRAHRGGFGNLGFEQVQVTETIPGFDQKRRSITEYLQEVGDNNQYLLVKPLRTTTCAIENTANYGCDNGTLLNTSENFWKVRVYNDDIDSFASPHYFTYLLREVAHNYDLNTGALIGSAYKRLEHDNNTTSCPSTVPSSKADRIVSSDVHFDTYGTPLNVTESHCDAFGVTGTRTENTNILNNDAVLGLVQDPYIHSWRYDIQSNEFDSKVRHSHFIFSDVYPGSVAQEIREPNGPAEHKLTTLYEYNQFGTVAHKEERVSDFTNDGIDFTTRSSNSHEEYRISDTHGFMVRHLESTNALGHTTIQIFDTATSLSASVQDPNGLVTKYEYDAAGRTKKIINPDGTTINYDYHRCESCFAANGTATWYVQEKATGKAATRVYHDALGREVGTRRRMLTGLFTHTAQFYNALGQLSQQSEPFVNNAVNLTTFTYDLLGRVKETQHPNGGVQTTLYNSINGAAAATTTDSLGNTKVQRFDTLGREKTIDDVYGTRVSYRHDSHGNTVWVEVKPQTGNTLSHTIEYDLLGRKTALNDPDVGTIRYTYNALGLLATQTNAENEAIHYFYDQLDRQIRRTDDATGSPKTHHWIYDNKTYGIGLIGEINGFDTQGSQHKVEYSYNPYGLLKQTDEKVKEVTYSVIQYYDDFNRSKGLRYPSGFTLEHHYNNYGILYRSEDTFDHAMLWEAEHDDSRGNIVQASYGNGVESSWDYDQATGLPELFEAYHTPSDTDVQYHLYNFDTEGNLRSRTDELQSPYLTQYFCYDRLYRLTDSPVGSTCDDVTGTDYTNAKHGYDAHGNIVKKNDISDYQYGNGAGPHAVTYANGSMYYYDNAGRMTSGGGRSIAYSAFGKPTSISHSGTGTDTTIAYGALQQRIHREDIVGSQTTKTTYIGKLYEQIDKNGQSEQRHYLGDWGVHIRTASSQYNVYLHRDHIGSIVAKTDNKDGVFSIHRQANEPWGQRQDTHWGGQYYGAISGSVLEEQTYATTRGFTDHEHLDGVGLIHMNGRVYDPIVGRFVSPDPWIQDPENSQSFNRYSYVWNNPLRYVDPTGETTLCNGPCRFTSDLRGFKPTPPLTPRGEAAVGMALDFTPGVGDAKAVAEAVADPTPINIVAAGVGFIPVVGDGIAMVMKGGKRLDNLADATQAVVRNGDDVAGDLGAGASATGKKDTGNGIDPKECFAAGTLIETQDGKKAIEQIDIGDKVLSKNPETGEQTWKSVVRLFQNYKTIYRLTIVSSIGETAIIDTTEEHPFYVTDQSWVNAVDLKSGDTIATSDGGIAFVESVTNTGRQEKVYNFEVEDFHTYFVGEFGLLVHNICDEGRAQQLAETVPDDYKCVGECHNFANDLQTKLESEGISGTRLEMETGTGLIASDKNGIISETGKHSAVQVGDTVFDNMNPNGVSKKEWVNDLGGEEFTNPPHAIIEEDPF